MSNWHPENLKVNRTYMINYQSGTMLESWQGVYLGLKIFNQVLCLSFHTTANASRSVEFPVSSIVEILPVLKGK